MWCDVWGAVLSRTARHVSSQRLNSRAFQNPPTLNDTGGMSFFVFFSLNVGCVWASSSCVSLCLLVLCSGDGFWKVGFYFALFSCRFLFFLFARFLIKGEVCGVKFLLHNVSQHLRSCAAQPMSHDTVSSWFSFFGKW